MEMQAMAVGFIELYEKTIRKRVYCRIGSRFNEVDLKKDISSGGLSFWGFWARNPLKRHIFQMMFLRVLLKTT